jgi:FlhB HrpN YscU SpaS Family
MPAQSPPGEPRFDTALPMQLVLAPAARAPMAALASLLPGSVVLLDHIKSDADVDVDGEADAVGVQARVDVCDIAVAHDVTHTAQFVALLVLVWLAVDPYVPKPERMNPGTNLKGLVSTRSLIDLSPTLVKVMCVGTAIYVARLLA